MEWRATIYCDNQYTISNEMKSDKWTSLCVNEGVCVCINTVHKSKPEIGNEIYDEQEYLFYSLPCLLRLEGSDLNFQTPSCY